jgi:molybdopterin molybdotransferase
VRIEGRSEPGRFINPRGAETMAGALVLRAGGRIDPSAVALLAACGHARVRVFRKPVVAILATGDEIVDVEAAPEPFQVRNSNSAALAAQVARAGGVPRVLPVARDRTDETRALIESGLESELLLISGGVSAGRYDVVEPALAALGARFYFDRVRIQPGQPLVFGRARDRFFFGLPGNPASTLVTFELFARAALELLAGREEAPLLLPLARLTAEFRHSPGLTRFLPARLGGDGAEVTPLAWHGSSDIPALARANCFLVADAARPLYARGDLIPVLLK